MRRPHLRRPSVTVEVLDGDALEVPSDVLVLKYAQQHHGVDRLMSERLDVELTPASLPVGSHRYCARIGPRFGPRSVLFVGTPRLGDLGYDEIQAFVQRGLASISELAPGARHVSLTLHGGEYGLDVRECFLAELRGISDCATAGVLPPRLRRITIIERDHYRSSRLVEVLGGADCAVSELGRLVRHSSPRACVFVAIAIDAETEMTFRQVLEPCINRAGFRCERVVPGQWDLLSRARDKMEAAALVVADVAGSDATVLREIAIAVELGVPTLLIAPEADRRQQATDRGRERSILYGNAADLDRQLSAALSEVSSLSRTGPIARAKVRPGTAGAPAPKAIELDHPSTWPEWLRQRVESASSAHDLASDEIQSQLGSTPVRALHATRLSHHEVAVVRAEGLRRATSELVRWRVEAAARHGLLDSSTARQLVESHVADTERREGVVWFCGVEATVLDPAFDWLGPFFNVWGGQAMWEPHGEDTRSELAEIGLPSLVIAKLPANWLTVAPDLTDVLWQAVHGGPPVHCALKVSADVPAGMIEQVRRSTRSEAPPDRDPFRWPPAPEE